MRDSWVLRGSRPSYSLIWTLLIGRSPRAVSSVAGRLNGAPLPQEEVALNSCRGEKLVCAIHCQVEGCWRGGEESFGITLSDPAAVSMLFFPPPINALLHQCQTTPTTSAGLFCFASIMQKSLRVPLRVGSGCVTERTRQVSQRLKGLWADAPERTVCTFLFSFFAGYWMCTFPLFIVHLQKRVGTAVPPISILVTFKWNTTIWPLLSNFNL